MKESLRLDGPLDVAPALVVFERADLSGLALSPGAPVRGAARAGADVAVGSCVVSSTRLEQLRHSLALVPHPEGGYYREHYRAAPSGDARAPGTAIFYLLADGEFSAWHRVEQDELWHYYEGAPLELHFLDERGYRVEKLGPVADGAIPCHVVPARTWQAARSVGGYTLVGNTVSPGFSFDDWSLADAATRAELAARWPEARRALDELGR